MNNQKEQEEVYSISYNHEGTFAHFDRVDKESKEKFLEWVQRYGVNNHHVYSYKVEVCKIYFSCTKIYYTKKGRRRMKLVKIFDTLQEAEEFKQKYELHNVGSEIRFRPEIFSEEDNTANKHKLIRYHALFNPVTDSDFRIKKEKKIPANKFTVSV